MFLIDVLASAETFRALVLRPGHFVDYIRYTRVGAFGIVAVRRATRACAIAEFRRLSIMVTDHSAAICEET